MKKNYILLAVCFLSLCFLSCSNSELYNENNDESEVLINIAMSKDTFTKVKNNVSFLFDSKKDLKSNSKEFNVECKEVLSPFIDEGRVIYEDILKSVDLNNPSYGLSNEDIAYIKNIGEDGLAELAFILHAIESDNSSYTLKSGALSCLAAAVGITAVRDIIGGTAGLMTATSALQILKQVGKRYLGYIGVAIAVYEFVECVS